MGLGLPGDGLPGGRGRPAPAAWGLEGSVADVSPSPPTPPPAPCTPAHAKQYHAVEGGLRDPHPYVREAAVLGVLKCQAQDPAGVALRGLMRRVEGLLATDPDPQVAANCLYVLQQGGGLGGALTRPLVVALLNHIRAFSEWAQCLVIDIVATRYVPATEEERFDILEVGN